MIPNIPFNSWSMERIRQGRKICTSRTRLYDVEGITSIRSMLLGDVKDKLWKEEGADSPEEFQAVWEGLHPIKGFDPNLMVRVHFFENPYRKEEG